MLEYVVTTLGAITSDISESPDGLLSNIKYRRRQEVDKLGHGMRVDDDLGMVCCSRSNVGQGPGSFEL